MEAQTLPARRGIGVEARTGHARDPDLGHEEARERDVVRKAERRDVGHHVVGAVRLEDAEARGRQRRHEEVAPPAVVRRQLRVVLVRHRQRHGGRLLQRRGRADGEEVVHLADGVDDLGRAQAPADAPAGHAPALRKTGDRHGALAHALERGHGHVLALVDHVLVDLIGHRRDVPLAAQRGDGLELGAREHLARRVVRRIHDDRARARPESRGQFGRIEAPVGLAQPHEARARAREDRVGPVVLVKGLEDDHLVARVHQRQQRRDHALGGAAADHDLALRIERQAGEVRVLGHQRVTQALRAPRDGVLVDVGQHGARRLLLDRPGRREVRETLREVDGAVRAGEPGHLADDRLGEAPALLGDADGHAQRLPAPVPGPVRLPAGAWVGVVMSAATNRYW